MNNVTKSLRLYAPSVVRYGMSLVILWFGINQIIHPVEFLAYVPNSIVALTGITAMAIVKFNGMFELLLSLHLFGIMYSVGYNEIGVRDFGLAVATFSIFMYGSDVLCIHQHKHPLL